VDHQLQEVPKDPAARLQYLSKMRNQPVDGPVQATLARRYGAEKAKSFRHVESFELCEYGRQPKLEELDRIFPK